MDDLPALFGPTRVFSPEEKLMSVSWCERKLFRDRCSTKAWFIRVSLSGGTILLHPATDWVNRNPAGLHRHPPLDDSGVRVYLHRAKLRRDTRPRTSASAVVGNKLNARPAPR